MTFWLPYQISGTITAIDHASGNSPEIKIPLNSLFNNGNNKSLYSIKYSFNRPSFLEHFKKIATELRTENGSLNNDNVNDDEPVYEELDRIITDDDILVAISNLKRNKSHGIDGLLNEYFIEYRDLIVRNPSNMFPCCLL
jgi:hypothetical protein